MLDFLFDDIIMDFHNYYSYSDMKFLGPHRRSCVQWQVF